MPYGDGPVDRYLSRELAGSVQGLTLRHYTVDEVYHARLFGLYASTREDHFFGDPWSHEAR
jgi:hypothetical protein